jgi:hypothetical protein
LSIGHSTLPNSDSSTHCSLVSPGKMNLLNLAFGRAAGADQPIDSDRSDGAEQSNVPEAGLNRTTPEDESAEDESTEYETAEGESSEYETAEDGSSEETTVEDIQAGAAAGQSLTDNAPTEDDTAKVTEGTVANASSRGTRSKRTVDDGDAGPREPQVNTITATGRVATPRHSSPDPSIDVAGPPSQSTPVLKATTGTSKKSSDKQRQQSSGQNSRPSGAADSSHTQGSEVKGGSSAGG